MTVDGANKSLRLSDNLEDWVFLPSLKSQSPKNKNGTLLQNCNDEFPPAFNESPPLFDDLQLKKLFFPPPALQSSTNEPVKPLEPHRLNKNYYLLHNPPTVIKPTNLYVKKKCGGIHRPWGEGLISLEQSFAKMEKNLIKAWNEHNPSSKYNLKKVLSLCAHPKPLSLTDRKVLQVVQDEKQSSVSDTPLPWPKTHLENSAPLRVSHAHADARGPRKRMEDAYFCITLPTGTLVGVLDGHGGRKVADYASARIQRLFSDFLQNRAGHAHQTLEELFSAIQEEILLYRQLNTIGSTAVICYLETSTNLVYTATLGDSEAKIYRMIDGELVSIPLSCVRDWSSSRDFMRANSATEGEYLESVGDCWHKRNVNARHRRIDIKNTDEKITPPLAGINVSRAFGDHAYNIGRPIDATVAKPKITSCLMELGDILILACDGLYGCPNRVKEETIISCIENAKNEHPLNISQKLVELALGLKSQDNVTVVTLKIH